MHTQILDSIIDFDAAISSAALLLQQGELVAFPTETVYGLGARVFDEVQIQKIFQAKQRPQDNPLIVHVCNTQQIPLLAKDYSDEAAILVENFFPGPLTLVLHRHERVPQIVSAGLGTVALRMPAHPSALALIEKVGQPLVAPSANLSGRPSPTTAAHVFDDMQGRIAAILDGGACTIGLESTVVSLVGAIPRILRPGAITREQLESCLNCSIGITDETDLEGPPTAPGMKYKHYAPKIRVRTVNDWSEVEQLSSQSRILSSHNPYQHKDVRLLNAQTLYDEFRKAERDGSTEIVIVLTQEILQNSALMNRIEKASSESDVSHLGWT